MDDDEKQDKLIKGIVGIAAVLSLGYYVFSGHFKAQEWFPFLPPTPPPDTLIYHADNMRRALAQKQYSIALSEAEWVLLREKNNPDAIRVRAVCLLRVGRFKEAEQVFRKLIQDDKKDISARLALATALRGLNQDDKARVVLLRIVRDPRVTAAQLDTAQASLNAMDFKEPLFADQPTPRPFATPEPFASPIPPPLARIIINPPGVRIPAALGIAPTPAPSATPFATPSPEPPVAAVTLSLPRPTPQPTPEPGVTETEPAPSPAAPLEIPAPPPASPTPLPRIILPATVTGTRRILPSTLPTEKKAKPVVKKRVAPKKKATSATKKKLESDKERVVPERHR